MWAPLLKRSETPRPPNPLTADSASSTAASGVGFTRPPLLDLQGFYVALRLVACAQSGHEVALSNLNLNTPPPKFVSVGNLHACLIYLFASLSMFSLSNFF